MVKSSNSRVLAFGTYDLLHPGHEYHLKKASKYGELYVVVARDSTVEQMKGKLPVNNERKRLENVRKLGFVYKALLGSKTRRYDVFDKLRPNIVCIGYDQVHFVEGLKKYVKDKNISLRLIKFRKSHFPERYKTSILRGLK
jgi:FAD synthetase